MPPAAIGAVVVVVIILVIIVGLAASIPRSTSPPGSGAVVVTQVVVTSPDNACGFQGDNQPGFNADSGAWKTLLLAPNSAAIPCTISSVSTNTSGFHAVASVPMSFTMFPQILGITVICPSAYNGALNVTIT
ncbi:MAG: hypothetical protein L3K14_04420 [Thermoplasmata archaeon]|nr:hypothetical protein [Thermoplasmata archaeon]